MNITINTTHTSNVNGRSQVIAKGGGKQRTVSWDHSKSSDWNHGNAAGTLAHVLGLAWSDSITHEQRKNGVHTFSF